MGGNQLPALAAARLGGQQQELAPARARSQPCAIQLIRREMLEPRSTFGKRDISGSRSIGQVYRIEPAQADQQTVDLRALAQPVLQPRARGFQPDKASQRVAIGIGSQCTAHGRTS